MVILCEECNYYIQNKCWHFGELNLGQQWEKIVRGCEKYRPWQMIHPLSFSH
jgi:hypothetical protein